MESDIAIAWADLTYKVKPFWSKNEKTILNELYGCVKFGTINALMGPSGAGKTTLLTCIYGKSKSGLTQSSKIFLNNSQKISACFIGQHAKEHLHLGLTVHQNLIYASKLKNSEHKNGLDEISHKSNVQNIMNELMISEIGDNRVDLCSGGEQRRLTIAIEMTKIIKPNLLCIDEPTTGLDSNVAENVMDCLHKLAKTHRIAIITSIHQPNNEIMKMFDFIYVLAKGGNCVFDGPPDYLYKYLKTCNIVCGGHQVPIEQLLKLASITTDDENMKPLIAKTRNAQRLSMQSIISEKKVTLSPMGIEFKSKSFKPIDLWYIMLRTMAYSYVSKWRAQLFQILFYIVFAFITCSMFGEDMGKPDACYNPGLIANSTCLEELEDDSLLYQNQNFIFFSAVMALFIHLCVTTLIYLNDIKIFINEHQNYWYSTGSYFWAKIIVELIPTLIISISYGFLLFYLSGQLWEKERLLGFILLTVFGFLCTESIGYNIGVILVNYEQIALLASVSVFAVMAVFCNYYITIKEFPLIMQYMSELAFPKFLFNNGLILIYGLNRCKTNELSIVLNKNDVSEDEIRLNFYKLAIYILVLRMSAILMLLIKTNINLNFKICGKQKESSMSMDSNGTHIDINSNDCPDINDNSNIGELSSNTSASHSSASNSSDDNCKQNVTKKLISIAWIDLTFKIPKTFFKEEKLILRQLNGFFEFGTINALMGSSGAGKTTLLKAINGISSECLTYDTNILLSKFIKIKTCYIVQEERDHILTGLTAKQSLIYASKLKNSDKDFDHQKNVNDLMEELLISNTMDTNVENCSGGEQKRLVIAMELTSHIKPNLICIDEPTSGLDSNAAEVVIECLKRLSENHNICVITSIHQPNNDMLMMFDKLYVLARGGQCVYSGRPQQLNRHLSDCGIECRETQLPIEVLLKYSCNGIDDTIVQKLSMNISETEKQIITYRSFDETVVFADGIQRISKRFFLRDLWLLLLRNFTYICRYYWKILFIQFLIYMLFGLSVRLFFPTDIGLPSSCLSFEDDFNNTCAKTPEKLEEDKLIGYNMKYNFFVVTVMLFFTIIVTSMTFTADLRMFFNQQRNGWYSSGAYYWSKTISELIPTVLIVIVYSYTVDIYESPNRMFFGYLVFFIIGSLEIQSLGHFLGIIFNGDQKLAVFASVAAFITTFLFSNFLIPIDELHYALQMMTKLSSIKLCLENILILIYGFDRCSDRQFSSVLSLFDITDSDFYTNSQLLVLQFLLYRSASLIALILKVRPIVNSKKTQEFRKSVVRSRLPSKVYISGLQSEFAYQY